MKKILLIILIIIICLYSVPAFAQKNENNTLELNSSAAILMENSTGRILYEKNPHQKMYPASITKIMTALLALEKGNLDSVVTASPNAISSISYDSSNIGMLIAEEMTLENLLYGLMVASANEGANVIAEHISGSIDKFVKLMNTRAKELGAKNTNFTNTNGLPNDNHYTTAYDMAIITKEAMKHEKFMEIVNTDYYELPPTNKYKETRYLSNTNYLINKAHVKPDANYLYDPAIGVKTGWTTKAKHTLVAAAKKNNMELISVVLGAEKEGNKVYSYDDTINLFEYGFNNFSLQTIVSPGEIVKEVEVLEAKDGENIMLVTKNHLEGIMPKNFNKDDITKKINMYKDVEAPVKKGDVLGSVTYTYNNYELGKVDLISDRNVEKEPVKVIEKHATEFLGITWVRISLYIVAGILMLIIILLIIRKIRRKNRNIYSTRGKVRYFKNRRRR